MRRKVRTPESMKAEIRDEALIRLMPHGAQMAV
jgi:hypothetical protein